MSSLTALAGAALAGVFFGVAFGDALTVERAGDAPRRDFGGEGDAGFGDDLAGDEARPLGVVATSAPIVAARTILGFGCGTFFLRWSSSPFEMYQHSLGDDAANTWKSAQ